jgi:signal transduction histidine kinase
LTVVRRRLFWKIYLTMLGALVLVGLLLGIAWRVTGDRPWMKWRELRGELATLEFAPGGDEPGRLQRRLDALGEAHDADISVYGADGTLLATSGEPVPRRRDGRAGHGPRHGMRLDLGDGRVVLARLRPAPPEPGLRILLVVLLVAGGVGVAAYPVTRRLTRRLEELRGGVEQWGGGSLSARVAERGSDEIAEVARSFNAAAARVEALLRSQKALLANASHELRSPLARLRMAVEMWGEAPTPAAQAEIARNLAEIDQLVDEILLASRLDHEESGLDTVQRVDLLGLAAEEAARSGAAVSGAVVEVDGDPRLLRRMIRNLLENGVKHGAGPVEAEVGLSEGQACLSVSDRGRGLAPGELERIFEPFYRPSGHGEAGGGWGLGLALVRQIARRHGGDVTCRAREGGGTVFSVVLPAAGTAPQPQA